MEHKDNMDAMVYGLAAWPPVASVSHTDAAFERTKPVMGYPHTRQTEAVRFTVDRRIRDVNTEELVQRAVNVMRCTQDCMMLDACTKPGKAATSNLTIEDLQGAIDQVDRLLTERRATLVAAYETGHWAEAGIPFSDYEIYIQTCMADRERHRAELYPDNAVGICPGGCLRNYTDPLPHCVGCSLRCTNYENE